MSNISANAPALSFNSVTFNVIQHDGKSWIASAELAKALGYAQSNKVAHLYTRNKDEFTPSMTLMLNLSIKGFGNGNSERVVRVFSLRGCHLIAMFAKTPIAKEFRKWVLDLLDKEAEKASAGSIQTISPAQQREIQKLVADRVYGCNLSDKGRAFSAVYGGIKDTFRIASYKQLPASEFDEAVQFIKDFQFIGFAPTSEKLTSSDMNNIRRMLWTVSDKFHEGQAFVNMLWGCLREATGRKSPSPFYVEDIPAIALELNRIGVVLRPLGRAFINATRCALKRLVKNREDVEVVMKEVEEQMKIDIETLWEPDRWDLKNLNNLLLRNPNTYQTTRYQEKLD